MLPDGTNTREVVVGDRQLSLAIGKEGQNARLAAKLTGLRIDIKSLTAAEEARRASRAPHLAMICRARRQRAKRRCGTRSPLRTSSEQKRRREPKAWRARRLPPTLQQPDRATDEHARPAATAATAPARCASPKKCCRPRA